jgi:hypothetical protein
VNAVNAESKKGKGKGKVIKIKMKLVLPYVKEVKSQIGSRKMQGPSSAVLLIWLH